MKDKKLTAKLSTSFKQTKLKMRKAKPKKRIVLPDPVFNDVKVSKFVNHLMYDGKKNTSYTIFYSALDIVKSKLPNEEKTALEIWKKALENVTPQVEVKSRRVGGATFQVPTEIRPDRKGTLLSITTPIVSFYRI